jgi:transposase InsO family protein
VAPGERREHRHHDRLVRLAALPDLQQDLRDHGARSHEIQAPRRAIEAEIRRHACVCVRAAHRCGLSLTDIAAELGVDAETLRDWGLQRVERARIAAPPTPLGAPPLDCPPVVARRVHQELALYGPGIGPGWLKQSFPDISYRDLYRITKRFRSDLQASLRSCVYRACCWTLPGSVWAMDYWEPDHRIDGIYRYVLDVRDLATGYHIDAVACEHADADTTIAVLTRLFQDHGAPLVLKSDNGSHFTADAVRDLLERHEIELMLSPAYLPEYNGACEAGHGSLKARIEALARRDGAPGQWTCNHLEAARLWVNRQAAAHRPGTAEARWKLRGPLPADVRVRFRHAVAIAADSRRIEIAEALERGARQHTIAADAVVRQAIVDVLISMEFLSFRSRPIRQHIPWSAGG